MPRPERSIASSSTPLLAGRIDAWTPDGVTRVIVAARDAGLTSFRLDLADGDRRLTLNLSGAQSSLEAAPMSPERAAPVPILDSSPPTDTILAPMLGVFYRQATPGDPPFATPGELVRAGQTIGLIEVMKTYHEVVSHRDGSLVEFLVADGDFVEFGQAIARFI